MGGHNSTPQQQNNVALSQKVENSTIEGKVNTLEISLLVISIMCVTFLIYILTKHVKTSVKKWLKKEAVDAGWKQPPPVVNVHTIPQAPQRSADVY